MATEVPSQEELYLIFKNEVQSRAPQLTDFEEGAINDAIAGATSVAGTELINLLLKKFAQTWFGTANGPEITGGPDDLETLAVDHFGTLFSRPEASPAVGVVEFSRPTAGAGTIPILAGTVVKTDPAADGTEQRFEVLSDVNISGLSVQASVQAVNPGEEGNVNPNTVVNIETALLDPTIVVTNPAAFTGGAAELNDADYRDFIRRSIESLRGATKQAIEAAALNVSGVENATAIEDLIPVVEWDIGGNAPVNTDYFRIPRVRLFIADINGQASQALIDLVEAAVDEVRACGVRVFIESATPLAMNWDASIALNPGGPNFPELSVDPQAIEDTMAQYIRDLAIGQDFIVADAEAAILAIWGPGGTNDITLFQTNVPSADLDVTVTDKLIPGTISVS
jgi:phage-related baseplate assembly protein